MIFYKKYLYLKYEFLDFIILMYLNTIFLIFKNINSLISTFHLRLF